MTIENQHHDELSNEGARRKDAILVHAQQTLLGRTRARRARRSLSALVLLFGSAAVIVAIVPRSGPSEPQRRPDALAHASPTPPSESPARVPEVERLDDEAMLAQLANMGVDAGIVEIDGQKRLVTREGEDLILPRVPLLGSRRDG